MAKTYTPESTPNKLYYLANDETSLASLMDIARAHFGSPFEPCDYIISSEYIHTRCIGYDLYDPTDYDNYIVVELIA